MRDAFWALLPPEEQRRFFLRIAGSRRVWPRLKTLIGNPPYSFLRPEDEGVLRASGICRGRARMAHTDPTATGYSEFGKGHYVDNEIHSHRSWNIEVKRNAFPLIERNKIHSSAYGGVYCHGGGGARLGRRAH